MVTTLQIQIADKQARVAVEGDLRNVSFTAKERIKLGSKILKQLNARGFVWAKSAVLFISGALGLTGRLEPAGADHNHFDPLPVKLSYDNLAGESMGLGLPSFVIRRSEWR